MSELRLQTDIAGHILARLEAEKVAPRLVVSGSRSITDRRLVSQCLSEWCARHGGLPRVMVHGSALGVDIAAESWLKGRAGRLPDWAEYPLGIDCVRVPAQWHAHGASAGPRRNRLMVRHATHLLAIWDGKSRGTAGAIRFAREMGVRTATFAKSGPEDPGEWLRT